jgi:hypothetical protein
MGTPLNKHMQKPWEVGNPAYSRPPLARFVVDFSWIYLSRPPLLRFVVDLLWIFRGFVVNEHKNQFEKLATEYL